MKTMRVLSIDWDYFQRVSVDTMRDCYPDGLDVSTWLSEITWGNHYATDSDRINQIGLMNSEYETLISILLRQDKSCPVMIANSHVNAYDFILKHLADNEKISLVNVDMHHDLINDNENVDCGNWIGKLIAEGRVGCMRDNLKWIHNPVSFSMYDIDPTDGTEFGKLLARLDGGDTLQNIRNEKYDLIFLARSDTWSPPHLDDQFNLLVNIMREHFLNIDVENDVKNPRRAYLQYAVVMQNAYKGIGNKVGEPV